MYEPISPTPVSINISSIVMKLEYGNNTVHSVFFKYLGIPNEKNKIPYKQLIMDIGRKWKIGLLIFRETGIP